MYNSTLLVHQFNQRDQQLALDRLYNKTLAQANSCHALVCAAILDSKVADYLHHLAGCNWDTTIAFLSY